MTTPTPTVTVDNGVNLEAVNGARSAFTEMPPAASFVWKAECEWVSGTQSKTSVNGFFGMGEEQVRSNGGHTITTDHPEHFASADAGTTPAELMLIGLAGCLSAAVATVATHRGIQINAVKAIVEGDMDMRGVMGVDADVRNGFSGIRVRFEVDADATLDEVRALVAQAQKRSVVADVVANPTSIVVETV